MKTLEEQRKISVENVKDASKKRFAKCLERIAEDKESGLKEIVFFPGDGTKQVLVYGLGMAVVELRNSKDTVIASKILDKKTVEKYLTGGGKTLLFTNSHGYYSMNEEDAKKNSEQIIKDCGENNGVKPKYRNLNIS